MAELNLGFAIFNPGSGNGDQAVSVSASKHTGRVERSISAQVATDDGSVTKQVTINQAASVESVTIDETASVAKTGGTVTINGKSNSSKLTFAITVGENPLNITVQLHIQLLVKQLIMVRLLPTTLVLLLNITLA